MAGEIRRHIDTILQKRSQGNPTLLNTTKTKLVLKGINVDAFTASSEDDPAILAKVRQAASEMGIQL